MLTRPMHRQVLLLSTAQALFQTVSVLVMTVGGLAGGLIASDPRLATAPIAAMFLGTALATIPAANLMMRAGRRAGFLAGAGLGIASGIIGMAGMQMQSLVLLCLGTMLVGAYQGFAQFYRFAASEVADDGFRPRAISLVLAGGIVAALLGPLLGRWGGPLLATPFAGSFLLLTLVSILAFAVLLWINVPKPPAVAKGEGSPLGDILARPAYRVALFGAATGYGVMILAMTATPLAMTHHHHPLEDAATVIQLHVLGMFLPSFFTGALIARFGVIEIMLAGVALLAGHVLLTLTGHGFSSFAAALIVLGVGWNFLYVGGTALLTTTYSPAERGRAQAFNDMMIFATGLAASLGAGAMLGGLGWQNLNLVLLPWLAAAGLALLWLKARQGAASPRPT